MTVEELLAREAIRHTIATYTIAGDRLRVDEFVAVFADDAVIETEGVPEPECFRHQGRQAIHGWIGGFGRAMREGVPGARATFIRHHLSTCLIELIDPHTARSRTYWVAYTDIGPDHCGHYVDAFRKVGARWLISHRRIRVDWRSSESLYSKPVKPPPE